MFDSFPHGPSERAERMDRPTYHADFRRVYESGIRHLNKLERGQNFKERGFASWEAFAAGEWDRALSLIQEKRDVYARQFRTAARLGILERRLRVVEFPVTPYVQWELFVLRLRVELGDHIRVLDARDIADIEQSRPVPEVVILGDDALYEVLYDEDGNAAGANRFTDRALIRETSAGFDALYERGDDFHAFFDREIAPLAPPVVVH
ncbi:hypothetical protein ADK41_06605 [Streptomyces caelestis]|uniref:DUF6879 domain-containing protein n=2 Tax=Streptomyces TaxID=1883 RepID=A0A0M8QV27_9ACTN|nr:MULTISPECIES: DUF6879 family protein [Streptomyces]KOT43130.1 hypothetical protein ADK41_06605 [Streptomyces caelestis]KOV20466.1 hypothetical protein ADK58_34420 [Streptomyces sp. XY152]